MTLQQRIEATLSRPEFWRGAAQVREQLARQDGSAITEHGVTRVLRIEAALRSRRPLDRIPEYQEWLRAGNYGFLRRDGGETP